MRQLFFDAVFDLFYPVNEAKNSAAKKKPAKVLEKVAS